ncbi:MAG: nickel-dependent hydrogenase large subunit [Candidatus Thermoplasmatota archaeon]|nr:nickel-dependent hydrogenase large subunit [Candidatus Thermoplasmatota archaeon]MBS3789369.1 nickel-dependent hydrogenase large subunit [Candidatus Thermoplasmatota archaeon]
MDEKDGEETTYEVPIGPIHPALKEPFLIKFKLDGEEIVDADPHPGMNHRGIEFMGMHRNPVKVIPLSERICGICSIVHQHMYTTAVEHAVDIVPTNRARYIRTIMMELERIHSHVLWAGVAAHEIGFDTHLHFTWKIREKVMDLLEKISGNRVNYSMWTFGGVRRDITEDMHPDIDETLDYYLDLYDKLEDIFLGDPSIRHRTKNIGILTEEDAMKLCGVGPTVRASGVKKDVRIDQPYAAYGDLDIDYVIPSRYDYEDVGDVFSKTLVRLKEVVQSINIIRQCVEKMPEGEITSEPNMAALLNKLKSAEGEGVGRIEAPRGEAMHYVRLVEDNEDVDCWKVRASTYNNLATYAPMFLGEQIADIPIIAASIDPCIGCMDRAEIVDVNTGEKEEYTDEELHELSVQKTERMLGGIDE